MVYLAGFYKGFGLAPHKDIVERTENVNQCALEVLAIIGAHIVANKQR